MTFSLHPHFQNKPFLVNLRLCVVLLEEETHYPWLILIPRKEQARTLIDLSWEEKILLLQDLEQTEKVLYQNPMVEHTNIAAIGNKTPQLHIHVIGRNRKDPAWPGTVWDHPVKERYTALSSDIEQWRQAFTKKN